MDFAKSLLSKYGWEEGKGLGKHETGITTAIKAKLKFDNAGIGHDSAETFTHHWWEHAFNDAINNISVCRIEDNISLKTAHEFDVSTKKVSTKQRKNLIFNNFLKSSTSLTNKGLIVRSEETNVMEESTESPVATGPPMTDEELFAACGRRTAHKGARHGHGLGGKLARVEEQDRKALAMISSVPKVDNILVENEKKRKKKKKSSETTEDSTQEETDRVEDVGQKHQKQKSMAGLEDVQDENTTLDITEEKWKRSKKLATTSLDSELGASLGAGEIEKSTKKHKKEKAVVDNEDLLVDDTSLTNTNVKRKKSKKSGASDSEIPSSLEAGEIEASAKKHKKEKAMAGTEDLLVDDTSLTNTNEKRKKSKKSGVASSDSEISLLLGASEMETSPKKHKKEKAMAGTEVDDTYLTNTNEKRKKSKKSGISSSDSGTPAAFEASDIDNNSKKHKKKKSIAVTLDLQDNSISENTTAPAEAVESLEGNVSDRSTEKRKKKKRKHEAELEHTEPLTSHESNENSINPDIDVGSIVTKAKKSKRKHLTEC